MDDGNSSSDEGGVPLFPQNLTPTSIHLNTLKPAEDFITTTVTAVQNVDNNNDYYYRDSNHGRVSLVRNGYKKEKSPPKQIVGKGRKGCGMPGAPKGPKSLIVLGVVPKDTVPTGPKSEKIPTGPRAERMSTNIKSERTTEDLEMWRMSPDIKAEIIPTGPKNTRSLVSARNQQDLKLARKQASKVAKAERRKNKLERRQMDSEGVTVGGSRQRGKGLQKTIRKWQNKDMVLGANTELIGNQGIAGDAGNEALSTRIDSMDVVDVLSSLSLNPKTQLSKTEPKVPETARTGSINSIKSQSVRQRLQKKSGRGSGNPFKSNQSPTKKSPTMDTRSKSGNPFKVQKSLDPEKRAAKEQRQMAKKARWMRQLKELEAQVAALKDGIPKSDLEKQIRNKELQRQQVFIRLEKAEGRLDKNEAQELLFLSGRKGRRQTDKVVDDLTAGLQGL